MSELSKGGLFLQDTVHLLAKLHTYPVRVRPLPSGITRVVGEVHRQQRQTDLWHYCNTGWRGLRKMSAGGSRQDKRPWHHCVPKVHEVHPRRKF